MRTIFPNSIRTVFATAFLAILCQGCFLFTHHSEYRHIHEYAKNGDLAKVTDELATHPEELNLPDDAGMTPLQLAAGHCRIQVVEFLIAKGADVNRKANDKSTPLHSAAQEGCTNAVNLLLSKKAKINLRDDKGRTPLKRAEDWSQDAVVQILRAHGGTE